MNKRISKNGQFLNILTKYLKISKITRYKSYNKSIDKRNDFEEYIHSVKQSLDNKRKKKDPNVHYYLKIQKFKIGF